MANAQLLERTLENIETNPKTWRQGAYAIQSPDCGTAYCYAGHAVALADPDAVFQFNPSGYGSALAVSVTTGSARSPEVRTISAYAQELLEIDESDAQVLFDAANTLHDLRSMVAALVAGDSLDELDRDESED
jgi:hypothetical protein